MHKVIEADIKSLLDRDIDYEGLRDKSVLVAGANSLIGRHLAFFLLELNRDKRFGNKTIILVRNLKKAEEIYADYLEAEDLIILNQDITDPIEYEGSVDYIFHGAGSASPQFIIGDPVGILKANSVGAFNILEFAREKRSANVVFASTREVYGKVDDDIRFITENDVGALDQTEERNCYPESKRFAESIFVSYAKQYGVPYTIVRIAHTYGPGMVIDDDGRVMADFISAIAGGRNIILNSDGSARRSFCYISDTIDGILRAMLHGGQNQIYNLANETEPYPIRDTAKMLIDLYPEKGLKVEFANSEQATFKGGYNTIPLVQMNTSKIGTLGWKPQVPLIEGMKKTADYYL
jgi:nucleoside-diphosphate-sugar epimerase